MTLQTHVPGFELCIALKQLGYPQSSSIFEWRWHEHKKSGAAVWDLHCNYGTPYSSMNHKRYSGRSWNYDSYTDVAAPLATEIALPYYICPNNKNHDPKNWTLRTENNRGIFLLSYERKVYDNGGGTEYLHSFVSTTSEAEARAQMYLYLAEKGLLHN